DTGANLLCIPKDKGINLKIVGPTLLVE
ncbi:MAG: hypothetical protein RLY82_1207, partial [Pseudomonadota bacterium]